MKSPKLLITAALTVVTLATATEASARQQTNPDGSITWVTDGRTVRPIRLMGPNAVITLGSNQTLMFIGADRSEAAYAGPFRGTLAQARAREGQSQSFVGRALAFLQQTRNSFRNGGVRSFSDSSDVSVEGATITSLDQIPPIVVLGSQALGPQCVARGQQPQLSRASSSRRETIEITVANESHTVVFEPGEAHAVWPLARPEAAGGQAAVVTPGRPYSATSFAVVTIDSISGDDLLPVLTDAGCLEQAQSVMDYIWKTQTEILTE
ncbi:hypothetical protein [Brevundimonas subvibrioides]|uniref:hypothetical protein n=1 Tax=Brevundimonas subvibrioides TaxID=74313 RepID=UPI0022B43FD2|nr:hypothetical protein [Brevundimonas subvibrioides]